MRKHVWLPASALLTGVLAVFSLAQAQAPGGSLFPAAAAEELIKNDIEVISTSWKDPKVNKKNAAKRAEIAALMIAAYAHEVGNGALREAALKLAHDIADGSVKPEAAPAEAAKLASLKGAGKSDPIKWKDITEIDRVMSQFKPERAGGLGLEKWLDELEKKALDKAEMDKLAKQGLKMAMIGKISEAMTPMPAAGKDPKDWIKWSKDMQTAGKEVAESAKSGKTDAVKVAVRKLQKSCADCHNVFR